MKKIHFFISAILFLLMVTSASAFSGNAHGALGLNVSATSSADLHAKALPVAVEASTTAGANLSVTGNATSESRSHGVQGEDMRTEHRSATGTEHAKNGTSTEEATTSVNMHATSTGKMTSELHRSAVALVVANLKEVAGKDDKIGAEVSAVAETQEVSNDRMSGAMAKVESRGKFKTFLIGSDYKNLGIIRSEIVTTNNSIDQLKKAEEKTTDPEVKADLQTQVEALIKTQTETNAFVQAHEDSFSLFGWLVKLFS
ncbi:MAG TPA: hypothetical protein VFM02_03545 [Candidatus Paceibacterota bacterium]|nr:hypothetical protein [Candidatus Paceibacterota bacterium]